MELTVRIGRRSARSPWLLPAFWFDPHRPLRPCLRIGCAGRGADGCRITTRLSGWCFRHGQVWCSL